MYVVQAVDIEEANPELPWPRLVVPQYKDMKMGKWVLKHQQMPPIIRGYFKGLQIPGTILNPHLLEDGITYMSVTPMEIESQAPHLYWATGHVMVMGAGMGVYLYNVLRKPDVSRVTLVEKSQDVIDILQAQGLLQHPKLQRVIVDDALELLYRGPYVNYLFVDIWPYLHDKRTMADMQKINPGVRPEYVGAWGQELEFVNWAAHNTDAKPDQLTDEHWKQWVAFTGLPFKSFPGMAQLAVTAAMNAMMY